MRVAQLVIMVLALGALGPKPVAAAPPDPKPVEGVVVKVAEGEVVIDLGSAQGVPPGARIALFRRMVVEHPITKKQIEDRFPIGEVVPTQVGSLLTIIRDVQALQRPPVPGDFAVYQPPSTLARPAPPVGNPLPGVDARPAQAADAAALDATFEQTLGQPLPRRIALYEAWLAAFPESPLRDGVGAEVASLRAVVEQLRAAPEATAAAPQVDDDRLTVRFQPMRPVFAGERVAVAIALLEPERVAEVRLLSARDADETWTTRPMTRDGDYYFRADLPAAHLARPGEVRYVVEVVRPDGRLEPVVGRAQAPERIEVRPLPPGQQPPGESHLEVMARYVDFNTAGDAIDRYFQFETEFTYDLDWRALRAVRVGVGIIDGEGGPTEDIDLGAATRTLAFNYAFAEGELDLLEYVGLAARLIGGNHQSSGDDPRRASVGVEARLRLGRFDETRFVAGVSVLDVLGARGFLDVNVEVFPRAPMRLGVVVTNLPVDADLGVQIEYQAGWRLTDWLTVLAEVGWNARTINHYGFTGGGGLALDW